MVGSCDYNRVTKGSNYVLCHRGKGLCITSQREVTMYYITKGSDYVLYHKGMYLCIFTD